MSQSNSVDGERGGDFAVRPSSLEDKRVAYVDLGKPNGEQLFETLEKVFRDEFDVADFRYFKKPHFSSPMPDDQIEKIVDWGAESVVEAISDCGSCNSSSAVDAIAFEQRGIPSVQIITDEFIDMNRQISSSHGYDELPFVTVQHPTRYLSAAEIEELAEKIKWSIVTTLTCEECLDGRCSIDPSGA